ncbi:superfamily II DNA/RNA helicase [Hydrogenoanaerobacterium saccharovorans]|uniref:Superfamily II DNA and RNA helicase n=1 Tax=Hydrogenoanaerobacterium saccharovorans TaxID=474960 RepID=A0A1H8B918_9FIRM|nr:DEAD/DEAH box helicase [Hydrogenoanaerobacterium saccharovorans]RPF47556.1 superfamily II DNA/RNA helicase [Hydrogenoanaerobacterium saccharovorans]SEM78614.1 Superfamily II DNA and RNA helicase [Hydrogenoanaerobacterium saccharovorans]
MDFKALGLKDEIVKALAVQQIDKPTAIQEMAIPKLMENKDVVIQSETGSGKTLAYLLPLFAKQTAPSKTLQLLVLVPTQELAMQVHRQVEALAENSGVPLKSLVIFGNVNIKGQIEKLREKPQIIIGTCGRIIELIQKKKITAHTVNTIVIDEADKMLDKQNIEGVKAIRKAVMRDTQIVLVSASISEKTLEQAGMIAKEPELVKTADTFKIPEKIQHLYIVVQSREKLETLRKLISILHPQRTLVFINKPEEAEVAAAKLKYHKLDATFIHGTGNKQERQKAIADFSSGKVPLLIATDIAARGLHIEQVSAVFSISISDDPMDYLHRAGRTGRGESEGLSVSIVTQQELPLIKKCQRKFGIDMTEIVLREGKIIKK